MAELHIPKKVLLTDYDFETLKPGEEVHIDPHTAYDPVEHSQNGDAIEDFILEVAGASFLTYQGWTVGGCYAAGRVSLTGRTATKHDQPTEKALALQTAARK